MYIGLKKNNPKIKQKKTQKTGKENHYTLNTLAARRHSQDYFANHLTNTC